MIKYENLSYAYVDGVYAVKGVELKVGQGEFVAVLGHNGSGKSTLAKLTNALFLPTEGKVYLDGLDTADEQNTLKVRQKAGMVFQNPDNQMVTTIVEEDVAFGPENLGVPSEEIRSRVDAALASVRMSKYATGSPNNLSGGQKQRIAIAGILAMEPEIIILDEPTAMLDPSGRKEVLDTVRRLNREQGITVLFITHFMEEAAVADRIVIMNDGEVAMDGLPADIFARQEELYELGLGVPMCVSLTQSLCRAGVPVDLALTDEAAAEGIARAFRAAKKDGSYTYTSDISIKPRAFGEDIITVEELSHVYSPNSPVAAVALESVSFTVRKGEFLGVIGHTGSGKTTLVQHLNGLLQPTSGKVVVNGIDLADKKTRKEVRRTVGMMFQYPEYQLFEETIKADVAFAPKHLGVPEEEIDGCVRAAMEIVGLPYEEYAERSPFELSGGQKRRAALAGILATRPEILVLDEPMAGLDPVGREEILSLIRQLNAEGTTIVMVSHSMDDIARLCDRVLVVNESHMLMLGTPSEVYSRSEELVKVGLGLPSAAKLSGLLREKGLALPEGIFRQEQLETLLIERWEHA